MINHISASSTHQLHHRGFSVNDDLLYYNDRLVIPNDSALRTRLLIEAHDVASSGHMGVAKTKQRLRAVAHWKGMSNDVYNYVRSCTACQQNKSVNHAPYGLMHPIPTPTKRWQCVTLDLIGPLPTTKRGHDCIIVFVDKYSKMVHFAAANMTVTAPQMATIFINEVVRYHGVPESLISDRDTRFHSEFWKSFWTQLGSSLKMSTAYHPQTDGQTEVANKALEQQLRHYVSYHQDNWDDCLVLCEIATNSSVQTSTGYSPYFLNYGQEVSLPLTQAITRAKDNNNETALQLINELNEQLTIARENIAKAQQAQAHYADQHREHVTFQVGDEVLLSTDHIRNDRPTQKLSAKYIGPFKIIEAFDNGVNYKLALPHLLKKLHNVFHVSKLRKYVDGFTMFPDRPNVNTKPPPDVVDGEDDHYEIEHIRNHRRSGRSYQYLVKWLGYGEHENSWLARNKLVDSAAELLKEYELQHNIEMNPPPQNPQINKENVPVVLRRSQRVRRQ